MKAIKYYLGLTLMLAATAACKKDYTDTAFVDQAAAPGKLGILFNITQDNSGLVTIVPSGEGVTSYDVYFGDGGDTYTKLGSGKTIDHKYAEGKYTVKLVGHNIGGKSVELSQELTVSFRKPENLQAKVTTNGLGVTVDATADYETMYHVYYGDETATNPEPFDTFIEGQPAVHTYKAAGTYTVRIVALSGGAATSEVTQTVKVGKQIDLPLMFDDPNFDYTTSDFGGNSSSLAVDPANASNKVLKVVKNGGAEVWAGTTLGTAAGFATRIPVNTSNTKMTMRIYSPAAGLTIKLKLENHSDGSKSVETDVLTTKANQWETLTFDFTHNSAGTPALDNSIVYDKASVFFDFGVNGSGKVFYMDDLQIPTPASMILGLPLTFESDVLTYGFINFDGGAVSIIDNPHAVGINTSAKVARMVKSAGQTYGGSFLPLDNPIDFSTKKTFKMKVWSPRVGAKVLLKVENLTNGGISFEKEVATTKANEWEDLIFDYSTINTANSYQKVVLIFDNGTQGDGSANYTFYLDDITLN
ncbi:MAG: hypothetical protein JKY70_09485 [Mucilaginibacter sp.]|nr:hypothetical protein [Mucilaginibacter sp.]